MGQEWLVVIIPSPSHMDILLHGVTQCPILLSPAVTSNDQGIPWMVKDQGDT